jgi:hypothetical protein
MDKKFRCACVALVLLAALAAPVEGCIGATISIAPVNMKPPRGVNASAFDQVGWGQLAYAGVATSAAGRPVQRSRRAGPIMCVAGGR